MVALTSGELDRMAGELTQFSTDLATYRDELARVREAARICIEDVFIHWSGPRADAEVNRAFALLDAVWSAPDAIDDQIAIVDSAARFASELVPDLQAKERWLASTEELLVDAPPDGISALIDDRRAASSAIGEISASWHRACEGWFVTDLPLGTEALVAAKDYTVESLPGYPVPVGTAYIARLAQFSVEQGIALDNIDPTGATRAAAKAMVGGLLASPDGQIVLMAIEANDGGAWDQNLTSNDAGRATDAETSDSEVRRLLENLGITGVGDATIAQLTALTQQSGWILQATWNDDIDQRIDAQLRAWTEEEAAGSSTGASPAGAVGDAAVEVIPSAIDITAPNLMVTEGLTAGELAGRFGLGADVIMTVGDIVSGEDATPAILSLTGETLVWSALPSSAPVVVYGGVAIFLGLMWVAGQAPTFYPDWSGMGTGPGEHPYEQAQQPSPQSPQLAPNGANPGGNLTYGVDCGDIHFSGRSHPSCPDTGGLTPAGD